MPEQVFDYDAEGNLIHIESPQGIIHYDYSPITGRKTRTWTGDTFTAAVSVTEYAYDALGRLAAVTVKKRNGLSVDEITRYTYNEVGSLKSVE